VIALVEQVAHQPMIILYSKEKHLIFFLIKNTGSSPGAASGAPADDNVLEPPLSNPRP
jgi:hypothetical protein